MALFTWQELIDRAKVYVDDDHGAEGEWIAEDKWLTFGNVQYGKLRKKWIRLGLVSPAATDTTFTTATKVVADVAIVIGIAEDMGGGRLRIIPPAQGGMGTHAFWSTSNAGPAQYWEAHGEADELTFSIKPSTATGNFIVRTIATPTRATALTEVNDEEETVATTIDLPEGCDERLVLGMAQMAHVKDNGNSATIAKMIYDEDGQIAFDAVGRLNGESPRARSTPRTYSAATSFSTNPSAWRY